MTKLLALTDAAFAQGLDAEGRPILVAFCASWCQPCEQLAPHLEHIAAEFADRIQVCMADVETTPQGVAQHRVSGYPTCILLEDGQEIERIQGLVDGAVLRDWLIKALG